jgi:hypothetical protein
MQKGWVIACDDPARRFSPGYFAIVQHGRCEHESPLVPHEPQASHGQQPNGQADGSAQHGPGQQPIAQPDSGAELDMA